LTDFEKEHNHLYRYFQLYLDKIEG